MGFQGRRWRHAAGPHRADGGAGRAPPLPCRPRQRRSAAVQRRAGGAPWQRQDRAAALVSRRLREERTGRRCPVADAERVARPSGALACAGATSRHCQAAAAQDRHRVQRVRRVGAFQRAARLGGGADYPLSSPPAGRAARRSPHLGWQYRQHTVERQPTGSRGTGAVPAGPRWHAGPARPPERHGRLLLVAPRPRQAGHRAAERGGGAAGVGRAIGSTRHTHRRRRSCPRDRPKPVLPVLRPALGRCSVAAPLGGERELHRRRRRAGGGAGSRNSSGGLLPASLRGVGIREPGAGGRGGGKAVRSEGRPVRAPAPGRHGIRHGLFQRSGADGAALGGAGRSASIPAALPMHRTKRWTPRSPMRPSKAAMPAWPLSRR